MATHPGAKRKGDLEQIARRVMQEYDFWPEFSAGALGELERFRHGDHGPEPAGMDLRHLLWSSIDNDDSMDLDQLTVAEVLPDAQVKVMVAVADVGALVGKESAIDKHARHNTTSVYTAGGIFPMLPEKLSTDLTSLNYHADRPAVIIEMVIADGGGVRGSTIYRARVRNQAKLAYDSVAGWLEGREPMPTAVAAVPGLSENLRLQDRMAQQLKALRHSYGALDLQTLEARPVFAGEEIKDLRVEQRNRAKEIIEDFMIAANGVTARFLHGKKVASLRRMVRSPKRWNRIVEMAAEHGYKLPSQADSKSLEGFLAAQKVADPLRFPDLSLAVIKLLGPGEYVVEAPDTPVTGHFGLAVNDYTHSTAPNRRFPDLITQRILKAVLEGSPSPYSRNELAELARHCTQKENDANKVERRVTKSAAAMLLSSRIGDRFDAICTGAAQKGTWVRIFQPPVEGRLLYGFEGIDVGQRLKVQLVRADVNKGHIDFKKTQ
ncbi:MAG: RNB domain-containing ribonuclease [Desulfobacterales bacterium]